MSQEKLDHVVAGALFSFIAFLTTREEKTVCSATNCATPILEALKEFSEKRNLSIDNPMIDQWESRCGCHDKDAE